MITIHAEGPILIEDRCRNARTDGHDEIRWTVETEEERTERVTLELPQGHVNLEGFVLSSHGHPDSIGEAFGHYLPDPPIDPQGNALQHVYADEWEVSIGGEWYDWAQQAHRYQRERPDMALLDALDDFREWDETETPVLSRSISEVSSGVDDHMTPMGELNDEEYERMELQLKELLKGHRATIAHSYASD